MHLRISEAWQVAIRAAPQPCGNTPGTLVDESLLNESQANTVAAIMFNEPGLKSAAVMALAVLSTGAFTLMEIQGERVVDELVRINPSELLYVETADGVV